MVDSQSFTGLGAVAVFYYLLGQLLLHAVRLPIKCCQIHMIGDIIPSLGFRQLQSCTQPRVAGIPSLVVIPRSQGSFYTKSRAMQDFIHFLDI